MTRTNGSRTRNRKNLKEYRVNPQIIRVIRVQFLHRTSIALCPATGSVLKSRRCQNHKTKGVNTLPKVTLRSDESPEQLLRRFSREVVKSRLLTDVRRKRWFVSKSELTRIAKKKAARRTRKSQKEQQQPV